MHTWWFGYLSPFHVQAFLGNSLIPVFLCVRFECSLLNKVRESLSPGLVGQGMQAKACRPGLVGQVCSSKLEALLKEKLHFNLVWSFMQGLGKHSAIIGSFKPLHPITCSWFEITPCTLAGFERGSQITLTSDSSHPADNTPLFDSVWLILFSDIRSPIPGNTEAPFPSKESSSWMETYVSFFPFLGVCQSDKEKKQTSGSWQLYLYSQKRLLLLLLWL